MYGTSGAERFGEVVDLTLLVREGPAPRTSRYCHFLEVQASHYRNHGVSYSTGSFLQNVMTSLNESYRIGSAGKCSSSESEMICRLSVYSP